MRCMKSLRCWLTTPCVVVWAGSVQAQPANDGRPGDAPLSVPAGGGHASVALSLFTGQTVTGRREVGGGIVVEIPFGRLLTPAARRGSYGVAQSPEPDAKPSRRNRPRVRVAVQPDLARACVRAAWRAHGVADVEMLDQMRSRARTSALLPEARLRVIRDWDQSYRLTPTNDDPYRLQESNGGGRTVEGRLTWKLDRLLFVDEELSMERLRVQRVRTRSQIAGEVLRALFDWQRARLALADPGLNDSDFVEASIREAEAAAVLDVLTGGWFCAWLEKGEIEVRTPRRPSR